MRIKISKMLGVLVLLTLFAGQTFAKEITVRGRLQKTVEAGGWIIVSGNHKYLLLNAQRYQNEKWFMETSEVEAVGETKTDVMTTYMEGTPFEVQSLRPLAESDSAVLQTDSRTLTKVLVSGDSIIQAQPDTAILTISVVTQARAALDAQQQNANKSDAVVRALKSAVGAGAEIKTSGYSLQPQRVYKEGQPPTISGYEARNTDHFIHAHSACPHPRRNRRGKAAAGTRRCQTRVQDRLALVQFRNDAAADDTLFRSGRALWRRSDPLASGYVRVGNNRSNWYISGRNQNLCGRRLKRCRMHFCRCDTVNGIARYQCHHKS